MCSLDISENTVIPIEINPSIGCLLFGSAGKYGTLACPRVQMTVLDLLAYTHLKFSLDSMVFPKMFTLQWYAPGRGPSVKQV